MKVGQPLTARLECRLPSAISVRGISVVLVGYSQCCWKRVKNASKVSPKNSYRKEFLRETIFIRREEESPIHLSGEQRFSAHYVLPLDLPHSLSLAPEHPYTGVFYTLTGYFTTLSHLRSEETPFCVESLINTRVLTRDVIVNRKAAKSLLGGGSFALYASLQRSILVAGDVLRVDIEAINASNAKPRKITVALNQQLELITSEKRSRIYTIVRVASDQADETVVARHNRTMELRLPASLPTTQTTPHGIVTIEYHVRVRIHIPVSVGGGVIHVTWAR
jgi:hypothetical protein